MTTSSNDAAAWERIGAFLAQQREELGYKRRAPWARAVEQPGFRQRVITDLELGARDNYADETLRVAEDAYRLRPGSIRRAIATGGLPEPLDDGDDQDDAVEEELDDAEHVLETPAGRVVYEIVRDMERDTAALPPAERAQVEEELAAHIRAGYTVWFDAKLRELERRRGDA